MDTPTDEAPDELEISFRTPVEHAGVTYAAITLRKPTWGEIKGGLKQGSIEAATWLASMLGKVPVPALNKLDARDGRLIEGYFARFW